VPDRALTPHELHQKSISVLDQLARLEAAHERGEELRVEEIDVVARAASDLRRRVEEVAHDQPDAGAVALQHLASARTRIVEGLGVVERLTAGIEGRRRSGSAASRPRPDA
jgi:hypothetical protein